MVININVAKVTSFLWLFMSLFVEPRVCGWAVLPAELPGGRAAELPVSKPLPLEPRWRDGHMLHPPKQEAPHPFTECQCPSTHAAFDAHTPTRAAGAQHHPHPAPQHQVSSGFPKNRAKKTLLSFNLCVMLVLEPICSVAFVFRSQWRKNGYDPLINIPFGVCQWQSVCQWLSSSVLVEQHLSKDLLTSFSVRVSDRNNKQALYISLINHYVNKGQLTTRCDSATVIYF